MSLLDFEPSLAASLTPEQRGPAARALEVALIGLPVGPWEAPPLDSDGAFGFLIGSGIVVRETRLAGSQSLEPLGAGDLLRPWQGEATSFAQGSLRALTSARVAVLDATFAESASQFPRLISSLMERALARSRYLAVYAAIHGMVGVRERLLALMWTLAERWGSLRGGEIVLPIEFRHSALAYLVGARRPSVSTAISDLQAEGLLQRVEDGWVLRGKPPAPGE